MLPKTPLELLFPSVGVSLLVRWFSSMRYKAKVVCTIFGGITSSILQLEPPGLSCEFLQSKLE